MPYGVEDFFDCEINRTCLENDTKQCTEKYNGAGECGSSSEEEVEEEEYDVARYGLCLASSI